MGYLQALHTQGWTDVPVSVIPKPLPPLPARREPAVISDSEWPPHAAPHHWLVCKQQGRGPGGGWAWLPQLWGAGQTRGQLAELNKSTVIH